MQQSFLRRGRRVLLPLLVVASLGVFLPAVGYEFLRVDDPVYVTENAQVLAGLSRANVAWAFRNLWASNWFPLTWLSHMTDVALFGVDPRGHHLVSVLLHVANAVLLLIALRRMTGCPWRSAAVAFLFALHPLHVESVAWVAERKDVLSTFFCFLGLWLYARYAERTSIGRYLAVLASFACGLMAKSMVVTFPFVLLLLDYWPLGRMVIAGKPAPGTVDRRASWSRLIGEKIPLLVLAALVSVLTMVAQRPGIDLAPEQLPLTSRLAHMATVYLRYLYLTIWPVRLAAFYPHPGTGLLAGAISAGVLVLATGAALGAAPRWPYAVVGGLWFLGTLVPVTGVVQVGGQGMADRYTYVPLVGFFLLVVWGAADVAAAWRVRPQAQVAAAALVLVVLAARTKVELGYWRNTETLFTRALDATEENYADAAFGLARVLKRLGRLDEAELAYRRTLWLKPDHGEARTALAALRGRRASSKPSRP